MHPELLKSVNRQLKNAKEWLYAEPRDEGTSRNLLRLMALVEFLKVELERKD